MTLKVITGGSGATPTPRKKHYLEDALWRAIYPKHATTREQIRERMEKTMRNPLTVGQVDQVMLEVRGEPDLYGWTIPHVQKGPLGEDRMYFPVLVDPDDPEMIAVDDTYLVYFHKGMVSALGTVASSMEHGAAAAEAFAAIADLTRAEKRQIRQTAAVMGAAKKMIDDVMAIIAR